MALAEAIGEKRAKMMSKSLYRWPAADLVPTVLPVVLLARLVAVLRPFTAGAPEEVELVEERPQLLHHSPHTDMVR